MEKTEQTPSNAPRRRRRRRGSGANAAQNPQAQQTSAAKEKPKANPPATQGKAPRQNQPRKEGGKESKEAAPAGRSRHRNPPAVSAAPAQNAGRRGRNVAPAPTTAKETGHPGKQPQRAGRSAHRAVEEDPGLELIARRPPKQKFANFEEYLAAHGGMTVPLPEEPSPELSAEKADAAPSAGAAE